MIIGLIIIGYLIGLGMLIRFFKVVHQWDEEIEMITGKSLNDDNDVMTKAA